MTDKVIYKGRPGNVCDDYSDNNVALVICRMLGFSGGAALQGLGEQYLKDVMRSPL